MTFVLITGNQGKADQLALWLGQPVEHRKFDLDEIQSTDLRSIVNHKVRQAYALAQQPVLVEDVALTFTAMGALPGTFIKWFLQELGNEEVCKLANTLEHQKAIASICYGYYDGQNVQFFENSVHGTVPRAPRGEGFGWNPIFIPEGSSKTYAEMTSEEVRPYSMRARAIEKLRAFLDQADIG